MVLPVRENVLKVDPHRVRATVRIYEIPSVTCLLPRHAFSGTDSGCGSPQDLSEETGTFSSMNYPNKYDNGKICTWHITVDPDKVTRIISGLQKKDRFMLGQVVEADLWTDVPRLSLTVPHSPSKTNWPE